MRPKRDSAFEQKTRILPSGETSGSSQNIFFSYYHRKKQSRAQTDIFGTSASFWKVGVFLSVRSPIILRKVCTKIIKTLAYNTKRGRPRFRKKSKAVFTSIRYRKTSQTQDVKSQSTERRGRRTAQPNCDSAFEQKACVVSLWEISVISQNSFFSYNRNIEPSRAQKDISGRYLMSFWKFLFCSRNKSCFNKYSISQDISNAGCKDMKYQT